MISFFRAVSAETLKLKRTLALWMTLISPAVVVGLQVLMILNRTSLYEKQPEFWTSLARSIAGFWAVLMLPLFVTLETALVANLEHSERHWKHLLALPVRRWNYYFGKFAVVIGLVALSSLILFLLTIGGGLLLSVLAPKLTLQSPIPWQFLLKLHGAMFAAAVLMISIHHWVSLRWHSFTTAIGFGITAVVIGFILVNSKTYGLYYPWSIPARVTNSTPELVTMMLIFSGVSAVAALGAGCWEFSRREFE